MDEEGYVLHITDEEALSHIELDLGITLTIKKFRLSQRKDEKIYS